MFEVNALRFLLSAFCFLPFCIFAQSSSIIILHTNDTHSHLESYNDPEQGNVGGVVRRNTLIQATRDENPNTIVVDAGDFSQGTPYFNLFKGAPEIDLMNKMGYDAVALGNHEFDNGLKALEKRLKRANFDVLCANYKFKNNRLARIVKPFTIVYIDDKKIGFFGLLRDMKQVIMPNYYQEVTFLDPIPTAKNIVEILKKEQCDLIICLSHLGINPEYTGDITDRDIAENIAGIDFIIGGHNHLLLEEPVIVNNTKILQARKNGAFVGKLTINLLAPTSSYSSP